MFWIGFVIMFVFGTACFWLGILVARAVQKEEQIEQDKRRYLHQHNQKEKGFSGWNSSKF